MLPASSRLALNEVIRSLMALSQDDWLSERESFIQLCQDEKETVDEASDWFFLLDLGS